jgi:hypothetical protein
VKERILSFNASKLSKRLWYSRFKRERRAITEELLQGLPPREPQAHMKQKNESVLSEVQRVGKLVFL